MFQSVFSEQSSRVGFVLAIGRWGEGVVSIRYVAINIIKLVLSSDKQTGPLAQ